MVIAGIEQYLVRSSYHSMIYGKVISWLVIKIDPTKKHSKHIVNKMEVTITQVIIKLLKIYMLNSSRVAESVKNHLTTIRLDIGYILW